MNLSDIIKTSILNSNNESYITNITKSLALVAEKMDDLKPKLINSNIINNSPFWMEDITRMSNELLYYKSLTYELEKKRKGIEEDKRIKSKEKRG